MKASASASASLSAATAAGCAAAGGGLQRTLSSWRACCRSRPSEGGWRQQSRGMSSSVGKNGPRRPLKSRAEDFDYHLDFARPRAGEAAQPPKKGAGMPAGGGSDDGLVAGISSLRNSRGRPRDDDAARKDEVIAQSALDQKLLRQHVDRELELWMRVEKEGGHRDIFQRWAHMDGYERSAQALMALQFPTGHWRRLENVQKSIFGRTGIEFERPLLLSLALMHKSWVDKYKPSYWRKINMANAHDPNAPVVPEDLICNSSILHHGNQGLEFLGDAVLKVQLATYFMGQKRLMTVEALSKDRAKLENNHTLGILAVTGWRISDVMLVKSRNMAELLVNIKQAKGVWEPGVLSETSGMVEDGKVTAKSADQALLNFGADCVEAIVGALLVHKGSDIAGAFVQTEVIPALQEAADSKAHANIHGESFDPVSEFQNLTGQKRMGVPTYDLVETIEDKGAGGARILRFRVQLRVGERLVASGEGSSMKEARRRAASTALKEHYDRFPR